VNTWQSRDWEVFQRQQETQWRAARSELARLQSLRRRYGGRPAVGAFAGFTVNGGAFQREPLMVY
jgi:hypothetical protein